MSELAATFSIVGRDSSGQLGLAVSSCVLAVGARCAFVRQGVAAIACQAYTHPYLACDALVLLEGGTPLADAMGTVLAADPGREWRQLAAIAPAGEAFGYTGARTDPWAGHRVAQDCAAAGNLLAGPETVEAMVAAFEQGQGERLPERLLAALAAGQRAGGDRRGKMSAAVLVRDRQEPPFVDLRVDEHPDPVGELQRVYSLMSDEELERARMVARSREPRPVAEIETRQAAVRAALAERGDVL